MLLRVRLILRLKEEIFLKPMFESGESERLANTNRYVVPYFHTRLEPTIYSHVRKTVPPPGGHVFSTDQNHFQTQEVTYPLHKHFGKVNATSSNSVEFHEDRTRNAVNQISP
ncbi:hypothetical protein DPMN_129466 [Dreissena polymorpha]|uniref:Uncharacterized protein n=1 Tax=Dreissena polymorpha TaxID=45954 RepID=A0A9D4H2T8_DREPO|nr:hypothetical protein DPMN_129466 [Dreissena polymorpha]